MSGDALTVVDFLLFEFYFELVTHLQLPVELNEDIEKNMLKALRDFFISNPAEFSNAYQHVSKHVVSDACRALVDIYAYTRLLRRQ